MLEDRIRQRFQRSSELFETAAAQLPGQVARAAEQLTNCLLGGNRILCCGSGLGSESARHLASLLVNGFQRERPGLPALALPIGSCGTGAMTGSDDVQSATLAHQVRALGQKDDILVLFTGSRTGFDADSLLDAVRDRDMVLLVLDDENTTRFADWLDEQDMEIAVPGTDPAFCHELHLSVIHCLCDLIDLQLFGEEL